jgi:hypothetical protein
LATEERRWQPTAAWTTAHPGERGSADIHKHTQTLLVERAENSRLIKGKTAELSDGATLVRADST